MSKIDMLKEILLSVESLENDIIGLNAAKAEAAEKRYLQLLNEFYEQDRDIMAERQYEVAKTDYEYFLRLLQLAIAYWQEDIEQDKSIDMLH